MVRRHPIQRENRPRRQKFCAAGGDWSWFGYWQLSESDVLTEITVELRSSDPNARKVLSRWTWYRQSCESRDTATSRRPESPQRRAKSSRALPYLRRRRQVRLPTWEWQIDWDVRLQPPFWPTWPNRALVSPLRQHGSSAADGRACNSWANATQSSGLRPLWVIPTQSQGRSRAAPGDGK